MKKTNQTQKTRQLALLPAALFAVLGLTNVNEARATLALTQAGIDAGFTLSNYYLDGAVQYPMLSAAAAPDGSIIGAGYARGELYKLNDVDGQTYASITTKVSGVGAANTVSGIASVGGVVYMGILGGGYYSVNPTTLATTALTQITGVTHLYGMWPNPATGHLITGTNLGIYDIDPITGNKVQIGAASADGVSLSPDGTVAYGAYTGGIINGYSVTSPNPSTPVFTKNLGAGVAPDGTAVISGGTYNGYLVSNNNDGSIALIKVSDGSTTIIASGGSRGDLVSPDANDGSLLLSEYEGLYRLKIAGGQIGGSVPEPSTMALLGFGLAGLGFMNRRRKAH